MNENWLCGARTSSPLSLICFCAISAASLTWPTCWAFLSVSQPASDTLNYFLSCCSQHRCALTSFSPPSAPPVNVTFDFSTVIYILGFRWCVRKCYLQAGNWFTALVFFLDKCKSGNQPFLMSLPSFIFLPVYWQHPAHLSIPFLFP